MRDILLVLAVLIMFIWPAISEDALFATKHSILFGYTESTNGNGSFSSYDELSNQVKKTCYGSGTIANQMIIGSNQTIYIYQNLSEDYYNIGSAFAVLASRNMAYKPRSMTIGTGYYAAHPLHFNISLGDKFQIENYAAETSMTKTTKYATAINGTLIAGSTTKHSNKGYNLDSGRIATGKGGKQRTSILPKPVLGALQNHLTRKHLVEQNPLSRDILSLHVV